MFFTNQLRRIIRVVFTHRSAGLVLLLRYIGKLPGFHYRYIIDNTSHSHTLSKGHADGRRTGLLSMMGIKIVTIDLASETDTSAYHFYLNRPVRDFMNALSVIDRKLGIRCTADPEQTVLETGCGAGRYLQAFTDYYGGRAIGVDAYSPAIDVANTAKLNRDDRYIVQDLTDLTFFDRLRDTRINTAIVSSFLVHYPVRDNIRDIFIGRLSEIADLIIGVEKSDPLLEDELCRNGFKIHSTDNYLYFAKDNRTAARSG